MPFVVAATYRVKEGEEGKVGEILQLMTPLSRQEPGCLLYQAHNSTSMKLPTRRTWRPSIFSGTSGMRRSQSSRAASVRSILRSNSYGFAFLKSNLYPRVETHREDFLGVSVSLWLCG